LVKKPDAPQDIVIPTAAPTQPSKPEVKILFASTKSSEINFQILIFKNNRFTSSSTRHKRMLAVSQAAITLELVQLAMTLLTVAISVLPLVVLPLPNMAHPENKPISSKKRF
jgi:hypothetical protein